MFRLNEQQKLGVAFLVGCLVMYLYLRGLGRSGNGSEGFQDPMMGGSGDATGASMLGSAAPPTLPAELPKCSDCGSSWPCPDHTGKESAPMCPPMPDMSKYVLKSSIPPCKTCPDMARYMLKTECPPVPDLSQYVLKSSIPKQQPIIIDTSADNKAKCGECPPCPRPRCPEIKCPPPTVCPACPPCARAVCPQQVVKCRAEEANSSSTVRPFLAPLGIPGFGSS